MNYIQEILEKLDIILTKREVNHKLWELLLYSLDLNILGGCQQVQLSPSQISYPKQFSS